MVLCLNGWHLANAVAGAHPHPAAQHIRHLVAAENALWPNANRIEFDTNNIAYPHRISCCVTARMWQTTAHGSYQPKQLYLTDFALNKTERIPTKDPQPYEQCNVTKLMSKYMKLSCFFAAKRRLTKPMVTK